MKEAAVASGEELSAEAPARAPPELLVYLPSFSLLCCTHRNTRFRLLRVRRGRPRDCSLGQEMLEGRILLYVTLSAPL